MNDLFIESLRNANCELLTDIVCLFFFLLYLIIDTFYRELNINTVVVSNNYIQI